MSDTAMHVSAIIAAGGRGERLGGAVPKHLRSVSGRTLLEWSIEPFDASPRINEIVVVLPADLLGDPRAALGMLATPIKVVTGGARRQDSVAAGLGHVTLAADVVVVHDAARPFCSTDLIARTIDAAAEGGAATAALRASDTVKQGKPEDGTMIVSATLPREQIFLAQTPQAFRIEVLRDAVALARRGVDVTDEATLAEQAGHRVQLVEGEARNIKVTTEADLSLAAELAAARAEMVRCARVGFGYDCHPLVEGRPLVLGGVSMPCTRGLRGHSDADAVCHAVIDALLGAAAAGDIGQHFPDDDPQWRDFSSLELLKQALALVERCGFVVGNVDVVVIADQPKISTHAPEMRRRLAEVLKIDLQQISIKGKTAEGLDAVGRGDAIAVQAVALLVTGRQDRS